MLKNFLFPKYLLIVLPKKRANLQLGLQSWCITVQLEVVVVWSAIIIRLSLVWLVSLKRSAINESDWSFPTYCVTLSKGRRVMLVSCGVPFHDIINVCISYLDCVPSVLRRINFIRVEGVYLLVSAWVELLAVAIRGRATEDHRNGEAKRRKIYFLFKLSSLSIFFPFFYCFYMWKSHIKHKKSWNKNVFIVEKSK